MNTLLYISGPSCSGKTTLREMIGAQYPVDEFVIGDEHWVRFPEHAFDERVRLANASILEAAGMARGALIVCEWVPTAGPFVDAIRNGCERRGVRFLQVALSADAHVLRRRKVLRDGDSDTDESDVRSLPLDVPCLVVDTGRNDVSCVFRLACDWLANKKIQRTADAAADF